MCVCFNNAPSCSVSLPVIEAVSLQGRKEEAGLQSTGSYVIGNTSLDFQRGNDRQTLRTHGPLGADYIIKVKRRNEARPIFIVKQPEDFELLTYIFYHRYNSANINKTGCCGIFGFRGIVLMRLRARCLRHY